MKPAFWMLPLVLFMHSSYAEMYKWVDRDGSIIYSDTPPYEGAEQLVPPGLTTTPAVKAVKKKPKPRPDTTENQPGDFKYTRFAISSPENDQAIRNNQGNIPVNLEIKPSLNLKKGHYISMVLDGSTLKEKHVSANITLKNIDRGSHSISALLKDRSGKTLMSSNAITLHLHRFSKLHNKAR